MKARVVVPHTGYITTDTPTAIALEAERVTHDAEIVYHRCTKSDSYFHLMVGLWAAAETFIIVEHDIVPWPGALAELDACPQPWCAFSYYMLGGLDNAAFGCTKFSADLIAAVPWIWELVGRPLNLEDHTLGDYDPTRTHWAVLDTVFADMVTLNRPDLVPHRHGPPVTHLNAAHLPCPPENAAKFNHIRHVGGVEQFELVKGSGSRP